MILVIWIVFLGSVISSPELSKLCFQHNNYQSVFCENKSMNLSCPEHQLIRMKDIQIKNKTTGNVNNCVGCPAFDSYHELENITDIVYFKTLLYVACSRKNKCNFTTEDILESFETDKYVWTAIIMYECVEQDLFKDICSPWKLITDSVHIFLNGNGNAPSECSCRMKSRMENTSIEVVDYRPYVDIYFCAGTSIVVDDINRFSCVENGKDFSVYNANITVVNNVTNITVLFADNLPQMIWIHVKGNNVTVECNFDEEFSSTLPSNLFSSDTISTKMVTTQPETVTFSKKTTTQISNTIKNIHELLKEGSADKVFTLPVIAGGSAGIVAVVVIIAVIVCILCRRKSSRAKENDDNENMYTECNDQSNTENAQTIRNGVINKSYETENEIVDIKMNISSSYEEIGAKKERDDDAGDNTEYAEPADMLTENISEDETNVQVSTTAQNKIKGHDYIEPFDKTTDQESQNKYAKVIKFDSKKDAYDICSGIDNYSHIQVGTKNQTPETVDNYSHIQVAGNKHETSSFGNYSHIQPRKKDKSKPEESADIYNHIDIDTKKQKDSVDTETQTKDEDKNDIEEEEYDHLVNFSHH